MTYNPNRIQFKALPRKDQDRIAGAIARGEAVEWFAAGAWVVWLGGTCSVDMIYRIPPDPKPAKDPNRPRPAHKLNLRDGDVVRKAGFNGVGLPWDAITVGCCLSPGSDWLAGLIESPPPKSQRPLFVVVSRANGDEA